MDITAEMIALGELHESPLDPVASLKPRIIQSSKRARLYRCAPVAERFWAKVKKADTCWLWTAYVSPNGYGQFGLDGRLLRAHRVAWLLSGGKIPPGYDVCHRCDVRRCVRPDHLFVGTKQDNMQDMGRKGRSHLQRNPLGLAGDLHWTRRHPRRLAEARNPSAKLTVEQVVSIRTRFASGETYRAIATAFGVSTGTIGFIVTGQHWPTAGGPITTEGRLRGRRGQSRRQEAMS